MARKSKSPLVQRVNDLGNTQGYEMKPDESVQYAKIVERIVKARNARELPRDEFDGMSYEQAYLSNKRAAISYLTPKKNDDEVRINTGTTEKRIELVMNELLALNLEGEVQTFDKDDNLLMDVSEVFTDLVKRTEQIEHSRDKDLFIYQELLTQPSVFVEELWIKEKLQNNSKKGFRLRCRADRRLLLGVQMYLGDVNMPDTRWNEQPYLIKYARMQYGEGENVFKELNPEKWKAVKPGAYNCLGLIDTRLYRKNTLTADEIEAFWYMSYPDNEVQIIVNGVPMLDVGTKYTEIFGQLDGYHITMVSLKPLGGDWAYGKPLTQSAKTLQALDNETIRNLIRKFRQALEPPMGVMSGKVYSRDIWTPGAMVQGLKANTFERLIDHTGVTRSEMTMFDLIEKKTNEFIGTSQQEPLQGKTQVTATELTLAHKKAIKMLGNSVLAVSRLRERLVMLRVKNLLLNATEPVGKEVDPVTKKVNNVYARFSLDGVDLGDQQGTRIMQFTDRNLTRDEEMDIFKAEQRGKKAGRPFQFRTINAPALRDLELYFYVNVVPKERESSQMDKASMTEMLNQGNAISQITGRRMNPNKIIERFERVYKERGLFEKDAPQMEQEIQEMQNMGNGGMSPMTGVPKREPNPMRQIQGVGDIASA